MEDSTMILTSGGRRARSLLCALWMGMALLATTKVARAADAITFRWRDSVRCGPEGTLRFDAGARLDLINSDAGRFEFLGEAKENSRRLEEYVITLTFRDYDDEVLFRVASEPFEMDDGKRSRILVFGREELIARYWDEIGSVELDAQVPGEPLFEDSFDYYDHLVRYFREQELEARVFRDY